MSNYNLYLDDFRQPIDSSYYLNNPIYGNLKWEVVRSYDEFVKIITEKGIPDIVSFDHDLADEHYKWFINYCIDNQKEVPEKIFIHSMNPAGSANIKSLFDTYNKYHRI